MDQPTTCPQCHNLVIPGSNFCSTCGFPLGSAKPFAVSIGRQIWIYFVSLVLPPLGLIWTFKYFKVSDPAVKRVAIIALVLTIISCVVTVWWGIGAIQGIQSQVSSQLNSYQNLGL